MEPVRRFQRSGINTAGLSFDTFYLQRHCAEFISGNIYTYPGKASYGFNKTLELNWNNLSPWVFAFYLLNEQWDLNGKIRLCRVFPIIARHESVRIRVKLLPLGRLQKASPSTKHSPVATRRCWHFTFLQTTSAHLYVSSAPYRYLYSTCHIASTWADFHDQRWIDGGGGAEPETRLRLNICEEPLDIFNEMSQHFPAVLFSNRSQIFSDKTSGHLSHVCGTKPGYLLMKHRYVWSLVCTRTRSCVGLK